VTHGEKALTERREALGDEPGRHGQQDGLPALRSALRNCQEQGLIGPPLEPRALLRPSVWNRPLTTVR
jgi:hypothetical protein